jgi:Ser/Thr protein kinase RdoA (MazF antagonist)
VDDFAAASTAEQVARLAELGRRALRAWSFGDATLELLKYRENAVFSVAIHGARYALRISRPSYRSDAHLRSEAAWMRALEGVGVHTPEMLPTSAGDLVEVASTDRVPEPRQCVLFSWIDGTQLGTVEGGVGNDAVEGTYRTLGALAATLHEHGAHWKRPEDFSRPDWGVDSFLGPDPAFGRFWELPELESASLDLLLRARDEARETLVEFGTGSDRFGLIHGDFLPENVLVSESGPRLIDFDDSGECWYSFELATALFPALLHGNVGAVRRAYLEGYRELRALPDEHLAAIPAQLMARGLSYLGWPMGRPEMEEGKALAQALSPLMIDLATRYLDGELLGLEA